MKAMASIGSTPTAAAPVDTAHAAAMRRRTIATTPHTQATSHRGATTGNEADRSTVSNVTSPIRSAGAAHENHGSSARGSIVSGRRYCTRAVGTNFKPNNVPPLSASAARRSAENSFRTWRSNGVDNGTPKRTRLTHA